MAGFFPFRGILYNAKKIDNLADVITPPYDVINDRARLTYHDRHPYNIIRLILGRTSESDTRLDSWHFRAKQHFHNWLSGGILLQDDQPSFYLTALDFDSDIGRFTRFGIIGLIALEPFENRIILPHEKTFSKVRSERLSLMKTCHTNFSPIFALYTDSSNTILETLKLETSAQTAEIEFLDDQGQRHRLWRISDPRSHDIITEGIRPKKIFIADGHHRYETALNYRKWLQQQQPDLPFDHPANNVMMYLSSMEDPGLIIRPAHRILKGVNPAHLRAFREKCAPFFDVNAFAFRGKPGDKPIAQLMSALRAHVTGHAIGVFIKGNSEFLLLRLKDGVMQDRYGNTVSQALRDLDVMVLTRLVLMDLLAFDQKRLDNEKLITYSSQEGDAIDAVHREGWDITFILNPTRIEQVRRIAEEGLIMPRKATYFYPKVITGLVINSLLV